MKKYCLFGLAMLSLIFSMVAIAQPTLAHTASAVAVNTNHYVNVLTTHGFVWGALIFLGLGLLLTFTPCVLPMIPIVSGIIMGQKNCGMRKAFLLSLTYVIAMALTYAIIGLVAGYVGSSLQTLLQQPIVIALVALLFIAMALSMFGCYELRLPGRWHNKLNALSVKQRGGHYVGVAIMGVLATLVVSPCVSAPLVGVLGYIGQTGNTWFGGLALFSMGIGMGIPLLIIGTSNGALLPKAGRWMNAVKYLAGILLVAVAFWLLSRIVAASIMLFLWGCFAIAVAVCIGTLRFTQQRDKWQTSQQALGVIILVYGVALIWGALQGNVNPWKPLVNHRVVGTTQQTQKQLTALHFNKVYSMAELNQQLGIARQQHQPVLLEFAADWCPDCQYMLAHTFTDKKVIKALQGFYLIRADITHATAPVRTMMRDYKVLGPPVMIFYNQAGQQLTSLRLVGLTKSAVLMKQLQQVD